MIFFVWIVTSIFSYLTVNFLGLFWFPIFFSIQSIRYTFRTQLTAANLVTVSSALMRSQVAVVPIYHYIWIDISDFHKTFWSNWCISSFAHAISKLFQGIRHQTLAYHVKSVWAFMASQSSLFPVYDLPYDLVSNSTYFLEIERSCQSVF